MTDQLDTTKLRELAEKLPREDFAVWTSNSWRRVYIGHMPAIEPCVHRYDNHPDLLFAEGVSAYLQAVGPKPILALLDRLEAAERERNGLRAARIAYASEFPLDVEGLPDVGSIHANIRKLKAALAEIADQDAVEMALDPAWAQRIAISALAQREEGK